MIEISVVIPCYNQGNYIQDAISSVECQTFNNWEMVIVNDGSTDIDTDRTLSKISHPKIRVFKTENKGLASARNFGIENSKGRIILPLDADDKIGPGYMEKAIASFNRDPEVGIVYSNAAWFGDKQGFINLNDYSQGRIFFTNMIFCSGLFYKKDWEKVGGYKTVMKYGYEDWEFWISLIETGRKVYKIPEIHFYYRSRKESMAMIMSEEVRIQMHSTILRNHKELFWENLESIVGEMHNYERIALEYKALESGSFFERLKNKTSIILKLFGLRGCS